MLLSFFPVPPLFQFFPYSAPLKYDECATGFGAEHGPAAHAAVIWRSGKPCLLRTAQDKTDKLDFGRLPTNPKYWMPEFAPPRTVLCSVWDGVLRPFPSSLVISSRGVCANCNSVSGEAKLWRNVVNKMKKLLVRHAIGHRLKRKGFAARAKKEHAMKGVPIAGPIREGDRPLDLMQASNTPRKYC